MQEPYALVALVQICAGGRALGIPAATSRSPAHSI